MRGRGKYGGDSSPMSRAGVCGPRCLPRCALSTPPHETATPTAATTSSHAPAQKPSPPTHPHPKRSIPLYKRPPHHRALRGCGARTGVKHGWLDGWQHDRQLSLWSDGWLGRARRRRARTGGVRAARAARVDTVTAAGRWPGAAGLRLRAPQLHAVHAPAARSHVQRSGRRALVKLPPSSTP